MLDGFRHLAKVSTRELMIWFIVIIGMTWSVCTMVPHLFILIFEPQLAGYVRLDTDYNGLVRDVDVKQLSPSGVSVGDVVNLGAISRDARMALSPSRPLVPVGKEYRFTLENRPGEYAIKADTWSVNRYDVVARSIASLALLTGAGVLALRSPKTNFVDVFIVCLGFSPMALNAQISISPSPPQWLFNVVIIDAIVGAAAVSVLHFAATLLRRYRSDFRNWCRHASLLLAVPFILLWSWPDATELLYGAKSERVNDIGFVAQGLISVAAAGILCQLVLVVKNRADRRVVIGALVAVVAGVGTNYVAAVYKYSSLLPPIAEPVDDFLQSFSSLLFFVVFIGILTTQASGAERRIRRAVVILALQAVTIGGSASIEDRLRDFVPETWKGNSQIIGISVAICVAFALERPIDHLIERLGKYLARRDLAALSATQKI